MSVVVQSRSKRQTFALWEQHLAFVPGPSPSNLLETSEQRDARTKELEQLLEPGTEELRMLVDAIESAYGSKLRILSADVTYAAVSNQSGPALVIDSIGTDFETRGNGMVNNTTEARVLSLCSVIGGILNTERVGALHGGHFKKLKVVWHRQPT